MLKLHLRVGYEDVGWIEVAWNGDWWLAVVNVENKLQPYWCSVQFCTRTPKTEKLPI
jgi:hypothetical protein